MCATGSGGVARQSSAQRELGFPVGSDADRLEERLADWEEWALDLLHCHLSYPMLAYYRSQHANQSWLEALTTIIDVSAPVSLTAEHDLKRQAEFTIAAGRHALVHTASVFRTRPARPRKDRLPSEEFCRLHAVLSAGQTPLHLARISELELQKLRAMYEPYANAPCDVFPDESSPLDSERAYVGQLAGCVLGTAEAGIDRKLEGGAICPVLRSRLMIH
jgi:hypothetical protein